MNRIISSLTLFFLATALMGCTSMNNFSKSLGHHEVYTETIIAAELEEVWAVITDASNYKNWNPVITEAEGTYSEGATFILFQPNTLSNLADQCLIFPLLFCINDQLNHHCLYLFLHY